MTYTIIRTNQVPETRETTEASFVSEITELLGDTPEIIYMKNTPDGLMCYLGSTKKNGLQPNRAMHEWNDYDSVQGYIPNDIFIVCKIRFVPLNGDETSMIHNTFGDASIKYAKELFSHSNKSI